MYLYTSVVDGEDYVEAKTMMEFEAKQFKSCVDIPILDDCVLEELESFKIKMEKVGVEEGKLSRVRLDAKEGVVRITDEQSKCPQPMLSTPPIYICHPCTAIFVHLEETKVVWESEEMVKVCASIKPDRDKNCSSASGFYVSLWTVPNSASETVFLFHIIS